MASNIIELNGKRYDALSGKMVTGSPTKHHSTPAAQPHKGTNLDGFSGRTKQASIAHKHPATVVHTKPQPSKTLMRRSVRKPQAIHEQVTHHKAHETPHAAPAVPAVTTRHLTAPERWDRAKQAQQSKLISKFSGEAPRTAGQPSVLPLSVTAHPETTEPQSITHAVSPFQKALEQATSHQQPRLKKAKLHHRAAKKLRVSPRILSVSTSALSVLLIGGFIAYQNVPNMAMRVASARSGVHASMPSYKPAGFGFTGPIQYKPGQITVNFKSNSDENRNFSITQSSSQWNSQTLLQNYVTTSSKAYQTYQEKGKTIYIYDGSNATWVDGGIWYNVQGNSSLTSDQLLRLANSI